MEGVEVSACVGICVAVIAGVADLLPVMGTPAFEIGVRLDAPEKLQACNANNPEASESFKAIFSILPSVKVLLWLSVKV